MATTKEGQEAEAPDSLGKPTFFEAMAWIFHRAVLLSSVCLRDPAAQDDKPTAEILTQVLGENPYALVGLEGVPR